jgi:hypothetical protein
VQRDYQAQRDEVQLDMYTGTLIKDLLASVIRAEQSAASRQGATPLRQPVEEIKTEAVKDVSRNAWVRNSEPEQLSQPLGLSAADWNFALLLIVHAQLVRALEPRHHFPNSIDVHQVGAVSPPEQTRVQAGK